MLVNRYLYQNARTPGEKKKALLITNSIGSINRCLNFEPGKDCDLPPAKANPEILKASLVVLFDNLKIKVSAVSVVTLLDGRKCVFLSTLNPDKTIDAIQVMEAVGFDSISVSHFVPNKAMTDNGLSL